MKLSGKVAVVTGASGGLGREVCLLFAREGADVVVVFGSDVEAAEEVVNEISSLGRQALAVKANVAEYKEVEQMVKLTLDKFGRIDILVNSVGIISAFPLSEDQRRPTESITFDQWKRVIDVNLHGTFNCCHAAGKVMIKQGAGKIINVSSNLGIVPAPERTPYAVSKAGIIMLTKCLALEWIKHGVYVNGVAPGGMQTRQLITQEKFWNKEARDRMRPMGRVAHPREVANVILFLASDESSFILGETIVVDGGRVLL